MRTHRPVRLAAALLAAGLVVGACDDDEVTVDDVTEEPGIPPEIEGFDIDGADQYLGQEVTVEGEVRAQIDDRTFHIEDDGGNDLLIYSEEPVVDELGEDTVVRVTGTVVEVEVDEDDFGTRHALEDSTVEIIGIDE